MTRIIPTGIKTILKQNLFERTYFPRLVGSLLFDLNLLSNNFCDDVFVALRHIKLSQTFADIRNNLLFHKM